MMDEKTVATKTKEEYEASPCYFVKNEDGKVCIMFADGEISEPLKIGDKGRSYKLPKNDSNKEWITIKKVEELLANDDSAVVEYKDPEKKHAIGSHIPNEAKAKAMLEQVEYEEYCDIFKSALEAKANSKKKPLTEEQRTIKAIIAAKKKLQALGVDVGEMPEYNEVTEVKSEGKRSLIDFLTNNEFDKYQYFTDMINERWANRPKAEKKPRGPLTNEQKAKMTQGKIDKLMAKLAALQAANNED